MKTRRVPAVGLFLAAWTVVSAAQVPAPNRWVAVWGAAMTWRPPTSPAAAGAPPLVPQTPVAAPTTNPSATPAPPPPTPIQFSDQTLRQIVRVTGGGDRVRVVLSNAFGATPVRVGAAHVARRKAESSIEEGGRRLTFGGQPEVTVPPGASFTSDPADLVVAPFSELAIDVYLPDSTERSTSALTVHGSALQTSYVSASGNHAGETNWQPITTVQSWFFVTRVEASGGSGATAAIVTIGDSITDGTRSTPNTNRRWPDELARRLQANAATRHLSVVNAGIAGNRLLSESGPPAGINLLARFDRDVLSVPGARYVVLLEGINDIGNRGGSVAAPTAEALVAAHRQIIDRAHAAGLKIFGATLTPFEGAAYFTPEGEVKRQALNAWIRTGGAYDGVIDFDAAVRDPSAASRFLPAYNSGDNLHPGDAGYKAMAEAVDLQLFR